MLKKIIIAGAGGQGIMLLGKVLASAAMQEGKFVTWLPAYGAEVRGGTAHCMVVISDAEIGSPYIEKADIMLIMNEPSLQRFMPRLKKNGFLLVNASLVKDRAGLNSYPFTDSALNLGNIKVANMVALGCLVAQEKIVKTQTILEVITEMAPRDKKELIDINKKALLAGIALVKKG